MQLEHALKTLEKELNRLNIPLEENEEEDLIGDIVNMRDTSDIKLALKILREFLENCKINKY